MLYRLTALALDDLEALLHDTAEHSGWERSMKVEERLFAAFDLIAATPGIGHLRQDLLAERIFFHYADPYLVLYRRDTPVPAIIAIIHGARDIASLMAERPQ